MEIMALFQELVAAGMTLLLVTHEPDIAEHAGRVIEMRDGQIRSDKVHTPVVAVVPAESADEGDPS
jgi:ABC-type lipoprotein export system ATPase subunit